MIVIARENFTEPLLVNANLKGERRTEDGKCDHESVARDKSPSILVHRYRLSTPSIHTSESSAPPFKDSLAPI